MSEDLFGNTIETDEPGGDSRSSRPVVNDMKAVVDVLTRAAGELGYVIAGRANRVFRKTSKEDMKPIPVWEANTVHQLVGTGQLKLGGTHVMRCGAVRGAATSVLVPKATKDQLVRWSALVKPSTWT